MSKLGGRPRVAPKQSSPARVRPVPVACIPEDGSGWLGLRFPRVCRKRGFSDAHLLSLCSLIFGAINVFLVILRTSGVV